MPHSYGLVPHLSKKKSLVNYHLAQRHLPLTTKTIKNLINNRNNNTHIKSNAGFYSIQLLHCNKKNTWGNDPVILKKQIHEHTADLSKGNINPGLVRHHLETNPNFIFKDSKILIYKRNSLCTKLKKKTPENRWINYFKSQHNQTKIRLSIYLLI